MKHFYALFVWLLLLGISRPIHGQNAVRLAVDLQKRNAAIGKLPGPTTAQQADTVIARCQLFFELLLVNEPSGTTDAPGLLAKYKDNIFLGKIVGDVFQRWQQAIDVKTAASVQRSISTNTQSANKAQSALQRSLQTALDTVLRSADLSLLKQFHGLRMASSRFVPDSLDKLPLAVARDTVRRAVARRLQQEAALLRSRPLPLPDSVKEFSGTLPLLELVDRAYFMRQKAQRANWLTKARTPGVSALDADVYGKAAQAALPFLVATSYQALKAARQTEASSISGSNQERNLRKAEILKQAFTRDSLRGAAVSPSQLFTRGIVSPEAGQAPLTPLIRAAATSTGSLQADVIDGTARFLADRLKQELNAAFFQRFATMLHDSAYVELQILFPATARLLTSGTAEYSTVVQTLRSTFESDLQTLLFNYGELLQTQDYYVRRLGTDSPKTRAVRYSFVATRTLYHLGRGMHPADLLAQLQVDMLRANVPASASIVQSLQLMQVLSGALLDDTRYHRAWLLEQDITRDLRDVNTQLVFLGLVWQRVQRLPFVANNAEYRRFRKATEFREMLLGFVALSSQLENQVQQLAALSTGQRLRATDVLPLLQSVQRSTVFVAHYLLAANPRNGRFEQEILPQLDKIGEALLRGYASADKREYGTTLSCFLEVALLTLDSPALSGRPDSTEQVRLPEEATSIDARYQPARTALLSLPQIVRYGSFMATMAQAKNPDDVKAALEAAALPVGSASIKRRSFTSVSLNAFVGVTTGLEFAALSKAERLAGQGRHFSANPNIGLSAPIGLAFSWGRRGYARDVRLDALEPAGHSALGRAIYRSRQARLRHLDQTYRYFDVAGNDRYLRGSSWSAFVSVVDLGVPVLFRLGDHEATALPQNIGFKQVLAPGLFAMYGLRNVPLSLFAGTQYTPQLRQLSQLTNPDADKQFRNSLRFNVGLTVDIPIFHLYTRTEPRGQTPSRHLIEVQTRNDSTVYYYLLRLRQYTPTSAGLLQQQFDVLTADLTTYLRSQSFDTALIDATINAVKEQAQSAVQDFKKGRLVDVAQKRFQIDALVQRNLLRMRQEKQHWQEMQRSTEQGGQRPPAAAPRQPAIQPIRL